MKDTINTIVMSVIAAVMLMASGLVQAYENENFYNEKYCAEMGGEYDSYHNNTGATNAHVDCETVDTAWEGEWPYKAYEAVGQSLWYAEVTGKTPGIIFYMKNEKEQKYIDRATLTMESLGVPYKIKVIKLEK